MIVQAPVLLIEDTRTPPSIIQAVSDALGPRGKLLVRVASSSAQAASLARKLKPTAVVFSLGGSLGTKASWSAKKDMLVPSLETAIRSVRAVRPHPEVLVLIPSAPAARSVWMDTHVAPLLRQAAREADAPLVDARQPARDFAADVDEALFGGKQDKTGWQIVSVDSEQPDEGPAKNAIDNDARTYWHTRYSPKVDRYPHEIVIDFGKPTWIRGFTYLPRQDGGVNGRVKDYDLYGSLVSKSWPPPIASGRLSDTLKRSRVWLPKMRVRYLKLLAKSEWHGGPWASAAEIGIIR